MRLLFDSNLSHRLKEVLGEVYPIPSTLERSDLSQP